MKSREDVARELARKHFEIEDGLERIVWYPGGPENEIRLLEVNSDSDSCESIDPVRFTRSRDVPYSCVIADVTPSEWKAIESGELQLPSEWKSDQAERVHFTRQSVSKGL